MEEEISLVLNNCYIDEELVEQYIENNNTLHMLEGCYLLQ
jgi:hypothetical protein